MIASSTVGGRSARAAGAAPGRDRQGELDKGSPIPLYYQLFLRIQADIQAGMLRPGDLLGTEKEIQERYGVSRATVRRVLDEVARTGQLLRVTGRGTFVAAPPLTVHAPHLLSLTEELVQRGVTPGARVLIFQTEMPGAAVAAALGTRRNDQVTHIRRLRSGDDEPIVLVDHFLHPSLRLDRGALDQSLYRTLERALGIRLQEALHTVRAAHATAEEAELLRVPDGDAVLRFERTTMNAEGRPVLFETGSARADRYAYSVHLFRR